MQRRTFIKNTAVAASAAVIGVDTFVRASPVAPPLIKKSLKYGMVTEKLSVLDKFKLLKDLGFDGVELDSPNDIDPKEILDARDKTGLELPG